MTDEVRQEDREAAADIFSSSPWSREQFISGKRDRTDKVQAFARHASPLRTRIAELEGEKDRLEVAVGWLADVSAATAYGAAELKSTSKAERNRQASIMEKVIAILDGAPAPSRTAQTGVRARCQRTLAELTATLNGEKKHG